MQDLTVIYPSQVVSGDAAYPYGRPRNVTVPGDGTGTPWEELIVRDFHGWMQAVIEDAGITISGNPESASASDILDALKAIFVDAVNGGNYSPSSQIVIDGAGLRVDGQFRADGQARFSGSFVQFDGQVLFGNNSGITVEGTFQANGSAQFDGDTAFNGAVGFAGTVTATNGWTVASGLTNLLGGVTVDGIAIVTGTTAIGGNFSVAGDVTDPITFDDDGRIVPRTATYAADADFNIGVEIASEYYEGTNTASSATRTCTLLEAGAQDGDVLSIRINRDEDLAFQDEAANPLGTYSAGQIRIWTFKRIAGSWEQWSRVDGGAT